MRYFNMTINPRIKQAEEFAKKAHFGQTRKGKTTPFYRHVEEVANIVEEITNDEDIIIAAWLHDTVEDTSVTLNEIESEFGPVVANYVSLETEEKKFGTTPSPWLTRKINQFERLTSLNANEKKVLIITLADKLANLREMANDYSEVGDRMWERFTEPRKTHQFWYYQSFFAIFVTEPSVKESKALSKELVEYSTLLAILFS